MKISHVVAAIVFLFWQHSVGGQQAGLSLKKSDLLNIGTIQYPVELENREDIPFKQLIDEEYIKLLGDTVNYEQFRPSMILLEKGFVPQQSAEKKKPYGSISITTLSGKYRFPKTMSAGQKQSIEASIKKDVQANLANTGLIIKKWNPFVFGSTNGLTSIAYSYDLTVKGRDQIKSITTCIYDSDIQIQIALSAPKKEYKKWLNYYKQITSTFTRKVNVADILTLEHKTNIQQRADIPFKYMVDKEFRKVLGDSIDYEQYKPDLLLLKQGFTITDSINIAPFGNITVNIIPNNNNKIPHKDSINIFKIEHDIKKSVEANINPTNYKISKWKPFNIIEIGGLPAIQYSYEQQLGNATPSLSTTTYIFDKKAQILLTMSSPQSDATFWEDNYKFMLSSIRRLLPVKGAGTILNPKTLIEERSDIPFTLLVDKESKRKLGNSINYEVFRPKLLFLKKGFNEKDSLELQSFNSITINSTSGNFTKLSHPDSLSLDSIRVKFETSVKRNLANTNYKLLSWGKDFKSEQKKGYRLISYSYTQQKEGEDPKVIYITNIYTDSRQVDFVMTCRQSDIDIWKPEYIEMIESFRLPDWR